MDTQDWNNHYRIQAAARLADALCVYTPERTDPVWLEAYVDAAHKRIAKEKAHYTSPWVMNFLTGVISAACPELALFYSQNEHDKRVPL